MQGSLKPYAANIKRGVDAVFFAFLHDSASGLYRRVCQLELHQNARGDIHVTDLLAFQNLKHDDVCIGHGSVIDQIVLPHQRAAFIGQDFIFIRHTIPPLIKM